VERDGDVVVSPADGTVIDSGVALEGRVFEAKGWSFSLAELVGDEQTAAALAGGAYLATYLSPRDYHRVHSPVTGKIVAWHYIPGTLFPVNEKSVRREPDLFARNERFVSIIDGEAGLCVLVMVAAVGVGHITASYDPEVATHANGFLSNQVRHKRFPSPPRIARGDEIGVFNLGSTTIVVFEAGRVTLDKFSPGARTRMGERLGLVSTPPQAAPIGKSP
jgi:phosphatidylserine decarboxylase